MISSWIAEANGCVLNEGGVNPCVINGSDWGETLATMFVFGWLTFLTAPLGVIALLIWLVALVRAPSAARGFTNVKWRSR